MADRRPCVFSSLSYPVFLTTIVIANDGIRFGSPLRVRSAGLFTRLIGPKDERGALLLPSTLSCWQWLDSTQLPPDHRPEVASSSYVPAPHKNCWRFANENSITAPYNVIMGVVMRILGMKVMKIIRDLRACHYMAIVGISLIATVLVAGMVGCDSAPARYLLMVIPTEDGEVSAPGEGNFFYDEGTVVSLMAEPDEGCYFVSWGGNVTTIANAQAATTTITMNDNCIIYAVFGLEIRDWYDLDAVRDNMYGRHTLMNDLDSTTPGYEELASPTANQGKGWQPIGTWSLSAFTGSFDGQGYEIRDLLINRPNESPAGLFGFTGEEAYIKDINMVNVAVTGYYYVGGLVGYNNGIVTNCYSTGNVSGTVGMVGGLVGKNTHTVGNSYSAASVSGAVNAGGLVGDNWDGTVSDSYSTGSVVAPSCAGGLVAYSNRGTVTNSYSAGSVTGNEEIGGLVGRSYDATAAGCFWDIETSGQTSSAGGTGKTTAEMSDLGTFSGAAWNICTVAPGSTNSTHIWNIVDGVTYPFLSWQS
jgi:Divergent InlB B-repeat domain/The GLUG motif